MIAPVAVNTVNGITSVGEATSPDSAEGSKAASSQGAHDNRCCVKKRGHLDLDRMDCWIYWKRSKQADFSTGEQRPLLISVTVQGNHGRCEVSEEQLLPRWIHIKLSQLALKLLAPQDFLLQTVPSSCKVEG